MKKTDRRKRPHLAASPRPPKERKSTDAEPEEPQPTLADLRALYDAALDLRKIAPWQWMKETDTFAAQDPESGVIGYCLIIGSLGETLGLNVFVGPEGLQGMQKLLGGQLPGEGRGPQFSLRCLSVIYYDLQDIQQPERDTIKTLGLKLEGPRAYPEFRSFRPCYLQWHLTRDEARFMTEALRQTCDVVQRVKKDPALLRPPRPNVYFTRVLVRHGAARRWEDRWTEPEPDTGPKRQAPCRLMVDEVRIHDHASRAATADSSIEVGIFMAPFPIQERKGRRPYFPKGYMAVDHKSGKILCHSLEKPDDDGGAFQEEFFIFLEEGKITPREILVENDEAVRILQPLTSRLGITLTRASSLPAVNEARAGMIDYFRRKRP